jgi:U6 snRNA-associated Sm-like protein LSm1
MWIRQKLYTQPAFTHANQDLDKDDYIPAPYQQGSVEQVFALKKQEDLEKKSADKSKQRRLANLGFEGEHTGEGVL